MNLRDAARALQATIADCDNQIAQLQAQISGVQATRAQAISDLADIRAFFVGKGQQAP